MGEAYPGSTGGEIFNCYEGTNRNVASGEYSTAIGKKCTASGKQAFAGGDTSKATADDTFAFGYHCNANTNYSIALGYDCTAGNTKTVVIGSSSGTSGVDSFAFGKNIRIGENTIALGNNIGDNFPRFHNGILLGQNLKCDNHSIATTTQRAMIGYSLLQHYAYDDVNSTNLNAFIIGQYNNPNTPNALFVIGCGTADDARKNAIEISNTDCKIINNLQLNTDNTTVNQITAPQDPNNITQDDQTLATKSYVTSVLPTTPADLAKQTTIELATPYTCALNTPIAFTTILNDNAWAFPYSSGSLHLVIEYAGVFMTMVCHVFTTAYSGTQNQPLVWCANTNSGATGKLRGIFGQLDQTNWTLTFAQPECVEWDNAADTLTDAMNDSTTLPVIYAITCLNHF